MLNAKDTLKKIADALNIAAEPTPQPEPVEPTKELIEEPTAEVVEEVKQEVKEEPKAEPQEVTEVEPKEDVQEQPKEEPKNERVEALEKQLEDLKSILADAMKQPEPTEVEVPQEEPKGLTHSPEKEVKKTANGVGKKGASIQERVFKYINNN
jgi:outer membrane biosynthesis protein TonB